MLLFCNYTQKNKIKTMILRQMGRYICVQEFLVDELTYLEVEIKDWSL
jgi:hypothetical protein